MVFEKNQRVAEAGKATGPGGPRVQVRNGTLGTVVAGSIWPATLRPGRVTFSEPRVTLPARRRRKCKPRG